MPHGSTRISAGCSSPATARTCKVGSVMSSAILASCVDSESRPPGADLRAVIDRDIAELQENALALGGAHEHEVVLRQRHLVGAGQHRAPAIERAEPQAAWRDRPGVAIAA